VRSANGHKQSGPGLVTDADGTLAGHEGVDKVKAQEHARA